MRRQRITMADWPEIERWIDEELLAEDMPSAEPAKIKQEEKTMDIPGKDKKITFTIGDILSTRIKTFCRERKMSMNDFGVAALTAALENAPQMEAAPETVETKAVAPAEPKPTRSDVLALAKAVVTGDRAQTYGEAEDNFGIIAELWRPYLRGRGFDAAKLNSTDVAMMMILLKTARVSTGAYNLDNFVDIAGYAACGGECGGKHG